MARTRALGTFESQLAQQDIQAKQAGAEQLGKLQSSQLLLQGQRDSYTQQVNAEFEAVKDSRRRQLTTSLVNFGVQAAGGPGAIGKKLGGGMDGLMDKFKTSLAEKQWTEDAMNAAQNRTVAELKRPLTPLTNPRERIYQWETSGNVDAVIPKDSFAYKNIPGFRVPEGFGSPGGIIGGSASERTRLNDIFQRDVMPTLGSANPLPNVSQFGRESLSLADAFLNLPQTPVATGATPASQTTPVTATPTFEEFTKMITGAIDPSDRQMNQLTGERVPTLFETLEIDKMIRDTGLPDMVGEGVSFFDRVGKDIMYRANPFIQFRNLQEHRAKEREEQLRELYNQRYNQRSK
jgi:hypothetical protein